MKLFLKNVEKEVTLSEGETVLQATLRAGVSFPHSCLSGRCGACKARVLEGSATMLPHSRFTLNEQEKDSGIILACRTLPTSDLTVSWLEEETEYHPNTHQARVSSIARVTSDIVHIALELQHAPLLYQAGQFARVSFKGLPFRNYSFVTASKRGERVEFFIRKVTGGQSSSYAYDKLTAGESVDLEGPFGRSYLRKSHTGPILAVAGGSGLAPILSILEESILSSMKQPFYLYFGVRTEADLFGMGRLETLASSHPHVKIIPVIDQGSSRYRSGRVGDAVLSDWKNFTGNWMAFLAGPPPMVDAMQPTLIDRGLREDQVLVDPFSFATTTTSPRKVSII